MNHGIADATVLVSELKATVAGNQSVQEALDAYQKEMIARAGEEVKLSLVNTEMLHDWSRFQDSPIMQRGGDPNVAKT
jgi:2-polyprenyl-6-methoxyphenol hydroxylase-like FAD-dependent oxidoreductase